MSESVSGKFFSSVEMGAMRSSTKNLVEPKYRYLALFAGDLSLTARLWRMPFLSSASW